LSFDAESFHIPVCYSKIWRLIYTERHSRTGKDEKKGKTQEKMERGSRKRSSSAWSEKMERVGGR